MEKGNPDVLLLDELSSGLDAVAKRAVWQTIKAASHGRSIVLTVSVAT
jgi:ATP-binding cassette, subfamily A (ABC1), member 3